MNKYELLTENKQLIYQFVKEWNTIISNDKGYRKYIEHT
jgi:hypothetical protein